MHIDKKIEWSEHPQNCHPCQAIQLWYQPRNLHSSAWYNNILLSFVHNSSIFVCYCCSVTQSCPTLCNPMDCSMPGFPVLHCLLEIKLLTSFRSQKRQESSRKTSSSALLTVPKPLTVWITINCGKSSSERDGHTRPPDLPLEKPVCRSGSNS